MRVDLAGGTLDLWPLYLFETQACTVNVAISLYSEVEITETGRSGIELIEPDRNESLQAESAEELKQDPQFALIGEIASHFGASGVRIATRSDAPRGSGLGGSSALAIALARGLSEYVEEPLEGDDLIHLVRDLETRVLGVPAGIQDYYPAVYGGLGSLRLLPGRIVRQTLQVPLAELARHLVLHYSGVAHFSGDNNWDIYRKAIDGNGRVQRALKAIAAAAVVMETRLQAHEFKAAGAALAKEWKHRKRLINGVTTPEIDALIEQGTGAGAWGGKVCGAGGGGCVVFLTDSTRRPTVMEALAAGPGEILEAVPVSHGLKVESERLARRQPPIPSATALEHYYLATGETGTLQPFVIVEASVTFDEARDGIHLVVPHSLAAPITTSSEIVNWSKAFSLEPDRLPVTTSSPAGASAPAREIQSALNATANLEQELEQFLLERERLYLFHNRELGMYAKPRESREAFETRCLEEARHLLEVQASTLEVTFRRKMDQVRERFEREQRQAKEAEGESSRPEDDASIPWGQILHDILSGRTHRHFEPRNPQESDFVEALLQLQRQWDRERLALEEESIARAGAIEQAAIAPSPRGVQLRRSFILWTASPGALLVPSSGRLSALRSR